MAVAQSCFQPHPLFAVATLHLHPTLPTVHNKSWEELSLDSLITRLHPLAGVPSRVGMRVELRLGTARLKEAILHSMLVAWRVLYLSPPYLSGSEHGQVRGGLACTMHINVMPHPPSSKSGYSRARWGFD